MSETSQCFVCQHFIKPKGPDEECRCKAFPEKIPNAILFNNHDHRKPYKGDKGYRFKKKKGEIW